MITFWKDEKEYILINNIHGLGELKPNEYPLIIPILEP